MNMHYILSVPLFYFLLLSYLVLLDIRNLLHTKERRNSTCEHLDLVLGEYCISSEIESAGPEYEGQNDFASLPEAVAEELFSCELSNKEPHSHAVTSNARNVKKAAITVDNLMSPAHTLLQIKCIDQKGLIYDILRTSKDCDIKVLFANYLLN